MSAAWVSSSASCSFSKMISARVLRSAVSEGRKASRAFRSSSSISCKGSSESVMRPLINYEPLLHTPQHLKNPQEMLHLLHHCRGEWFLDS
jgi:hypothetical protein